MKQSSSKRPWEAVIVASVLLAAGAGTGPAAVAAQAPFAGEYDVDERIRSRIEAGNGLAGPIIVAAGERVHAAAELPRFYERRGFTPAWVESGRLTASADNLIAALERADREGLNPEDYHLARIRELTEAVSVSVTDTAVDTAERTTLADLDLLLTDAFLLYGAHLVAGRVDPVGIHPEWNAAARDTDLVAVLESALMTGTIGTALEDLLPAHPGYARLRDALARHRAVAADGGWPMVPGRTLRPGDRGSDVAVLKRRLALGGDLAAADASGDVYDAAVTAAVQRFQRRHALTADGVMGLSTSALLNVTAADRIHQIELNLERWRWLPRDLGARHVVVNIAGFDVQLVEGDSTVFRSRAVVGQGYRRTPVFSDRMSYLVLNPTWTIPPNILEVDKLPLIRLDAGYLARNNIRVFGPDGREVDPSTVDWSAMTGNTRHRLRMDPGPENPLGRIKFMFPNPHHVYLHDTPERDLFDRTNRAFSSGCIRVENPLELAALLLRDGGGWSRARIEEALSRPGEQTIPLSRPVPVHLLYWTVWVESDGAVNFRPDVYGRDAVLDEALHRPPPIASARARGRTGQGA